MNVVYLKTKRKPVRHNLVLTVTGYVISGLITVILSPVIAVVYLTNQFRCDHIWIPNGQKNSCVKCNKKQPRKELLGLERL